VRAAEHAAAVAGLGLWGLVLGLGRSYETDAFFRVRVGEEILRRHALLVTNTFSFTYPDSPDLDTAWLAEVAMAGAARLGGWPAVVLGKAVLVGVLALALASTACRLASGAASVIAAALALVVMQDRLVERPHLVSLLGGALFLGFLVREASLPALTSRRLLVVTLALALWANAHAGVFVAPLTAGALALGAWLPWPGARHEARARRYALWTAVAAAACLLQPHGLLGLARYLVLHLTLPRLHTIDEFRAATWRSDALFLSVVVAGAGGTLVGWARAPALRPWFGVAWVLTALALSSVRFSADATIAWVPLAAVALDRLFRRVPRLGPAAATATLVIGGALTARARAHHGEPLLRPEMAVPVPAEALAFVEAHGLRARMYNDFEAGSYLLWQGYPRFRVFVDPRLPAYPASFHALLGRFDHDRASWDQAMTAFGVDSALLVEAGLNRRVAWWDPARWALVYRAHDARVFVRRREPWRALIAAQEVPLTYDFTVEEGARPHLLLTRPATSPVSDCEWQRRLGDLAFELDGETLAHAEAFYRQALAVPGCLSRDAEVGLLAWLGGALRLAGRPREALPLLTRARTLTPDDAAVAVNEALCLEALGRSREAEQAWRELGAREGDTELGRRARARSRSAAPPQTP